MGRLQKIASVTAFILASVASAHAADPPYMPPQAQNSPFMVEEYATGWYLRGDVGYRQNSLGNVKIEFAPYQLANNRLNESLNFGGGVGFKTGWFRADLTFDYGSVIYRGSTSVPNDYQMKLGVLVGMLNGYIDLGTWKGFTPYLGAGVGASQVSSLHFTSQTYVVPEPARINEKWNGAWAAMAGVAYQLPNSWLIDFGYRYLDYGTALTEYDFWRNRIEIRDLTSHEVRLGLRYAFD